MGRLPIDLLADAAIVAVYQVGNLRAARQRYSHKIAQGVVLVGGRLAADGLALKLAVGRVGISRAAVLDQAVLVVVAADNRAAVARDA